MAKIDSFNYRFTVLLYNCDENLMNGFASVHDLEKTKRVALSALRLDSRAGLAAIHHYAPHAAELANEEPVARVSLDDVVED